MTSFRASAFFVRVNTSLRWRWDRTWKRYLAAPLLRAGVRLTPGSDRKTAILRNFGPYMDCGNHAYVARTTFGARIRGNTVDLIQRYLYVFGTWEPNLTAWIARSLRADDVFVDIGANIGYYTLLAAGAVGATGSVVAIEASPDIFAKLKANLALNRAANVRALNIAVSDRSGTLPIYRAADENMGNSSTLMVEGSALEAIVPAAPLGEILRDDELARTRIIKIDVEGGEHAVVAGLAPLLTRLPPRAEVVVEVAPQRLTELGHDADDVVATFRAAGFHPYAIANDYRSVAYVSTAPPAPPRRIRGAITEQVDVVFSRTDAESL